MGASRTGLGLFLSWQPPLLIFKMSLRAKTLSELSIAPGFTDCPPASFPSSSGDQSISLCPCRGFWPPQKEGVFLSAWMGLAQAHRNLGGPVHHQELESGQRGWELWLPTRISSQRDRGRNFALAPLEMLLLHSAWIHPLSRLLQEPQTLQTPPNLVPCPPELPQCRSRWPGAARVPQGDTQGCSGYCRAIPRDAGLSLGVTIVTEQHLCSPAGNLLFHPTLRWTLSNSFLPLHKGNTKSSPRGPSSSTPSHTRFHPTEKQDPDRKSVV